MIFSPLRSMRTRMTASFVLFISIVVLIGTIGLVVLLRHVALARAVARLNITYVSAQEIVEKYKNTPSPHTPSLVTIMRENQSEITDANVVARVLDVHNKVLWQSQKGLPVWQPDAPPWRWRTLSLGSQRLLLSIPQQAIQLKLIERSWALVTLSFVVILGTALGAWWVVGRTLSPISDLSRQVQQASQEGLRVRLDVPSQDEEMVELVKTFNDLLEHLGKEAEMRSRFYAIASHELRTPLQSLSGHLELSLARPRSNNEYHKVLGESLAQTRRLILLVQTLLQLYQIENRALPSPVDADLSKIIDSQLAMLRPFAERRNVAICCEVDALIHQAIPGHFDIMVRNLIENAIKYSLRDSPISIMLHEIGGKVLLRISNKYDPAISGTSEAGSQRKSPKVESYGLGMTICQAITDANRWHMKMTREDGRMAVEVLL